MDMVNIPVDGVDKNTLRSGVLLDVLKYGRPDTVVQKRRMVLCGPNEMYPNLDPRHKNLAEANRNFRRKCLAKAFVSVFQVH